MRPIVAALRQGYALLELTQALFRHTQDMEITQPGNDQPGHTWANVRRLVGGPAALVKAEDLVKRALRIGDENLDPYGRIQSVAT
jgi:hypothetical protein